MVYSRVISVSFSPAGNTRTAVETVAARVAEQLNLPLQIIDITSKASRRDKTVFENNDIVVFGVPVYAGRVPNKLINDIRAMFIANASVSVPVVTFGNRSYDNALAELAYEMESFGSKVIAAAAIVSEHAFTDKLAKGRPDDNDICDIIEFADAVSRKAEVNDMSPVIVPGDPFAPYYTPLDENGEAANFLKAKPKTAVDLCTNCGACSEICPMGSVSKQDPSKIEGICIKCHACVRNCTVGAKYFDDPSFLSHVRMLVKYYTDRADSLFIV